MTIVKQNYIFDTKEKAEKFYNDMLKKQNKTSNNSICHVHNVDNAASIRYILPECSDFFHLCDIEIND